MSPPAPSSTPALTPMPLTRLLRSVQHGLQGGGARPPRWPSGLRSPDKRSASGGFAFVADPGSGLRPYPGYVASSPAPALHHPMYCPPFAARFAPVIQLARSEEHTSELQSLMRISYAVFCLKKKTTHQLNNLSKQTQRNN